MVKEKITKCNECGLKTTDKRIGTFICKKCEKEMNKPIRTGVYLFITIILLAIVIQNFEYQMI